MTETSLELLVDSPVSRAAYKDPTGSSGLPQHPSEVKVIVPVKRRVRLRDIWASRRLAWVVAIRDTKIKYKQSILGPFWLLIQPLGMVVAFTLVFSGVTKVNTGGVPYPLFALTGLTVWTFVQTVLIASSSSQVQNRELIRRVACPRIGFVTASLLASFVPMVVTLAITVGGLIVAGEGLPLRALLAPAIVAWFAIFSWGIAMILASLTARFRDITAILPFLFQAGVFLSPIAYPASDAPTNMAWLLSLNPLTGMLETWRWSVLGSDFDSLAAFIAAGWSVFFLFVGWQIFTRMETRFADYI